MKVFLEIFPEISETGAEEIYERTNQVFNKSDRPNPHERIINIGGVNPDGGRWKRSQQQAVLDIESGTYDYYVSVGGRTVSVIVATSQWGNKYIETTADIRTIC